MFVIRRNVCHYNPAPVLGRTVARNIVFISSNVKAKQLIGKSNVESSSAER